MDTLQELAALTLARTPSAHAIEFEGQWHTWGDLAKLARRISALLTASGIAADGPVSLISRNHPAVVAALVGLIAEARNIRMIYAFQSTAGIIRDLRRLQPAAFILTAQDFTPELGEELAEQGIATVLLADGLQGGMTATPAVDLAQAGPAAAARHFTGEPQIEILTSGTTGPPKQFPIPYAMIRQHLIGGGLTRPKLDTTAPAPPPMLLYMPIGNISGIYTTLPAVLNGQRARLLERFNIPAWLDYVKTYRPQSHGIPPSMMQQLLDANVPQEDLASLKSMGSGAAPLDPAVQARAQDASVLGFQTVLNMAALTPTERAVFTNAPRGPATLSPAELGPTLLEPHATWMTQISAEWSARYGLAP